jgi:AraC-like DNA-binding protein
MTMSAKLEVGVLPVLDVLAPRTMVQMDREQVSIWRPGDDAGVLLMAGRTDRYAIDPRGEYVFGVIERGGMRARRGRGQHEVGPGDLVAWDPSAPHAGSAREPWTSRLMVIEVADFEVLADDAEQPLTRDVVFDDPVIDDAELAMHFVRLHRALEHPSSRLERDAHIAEWIDALLTRTAHRRRGSRPTPDDQRALRLASEYLAADPTRNVSLDELAAVAGIGKFRLVRLFRAQTGLPPHALQLAHRIRLARRRLEGGATIADAAVDSGFADQSHLHRHFLRSLGMTPRAYQRRVRAD